MINKFIKDSLSGFSDPQPVGIGGFKAYATVRESTSGTRQLPSSVLEDGGHAHDHIIIEPIKVDMTIDISDNFVELEPNIPIFKAVDRSLGSITQYIPARAMSTVNKMNSIRTGLEQTIRRADNALDAGANLFTMLGGAGLSSHRDNFVQALHSLHNSDALVTIQTKHKTYKNMALSSFDYSTDNKRQAIEANLTFEQLEFRSLLEVAVDKLQKNPAPAAASSVGGVVEKGSQAVTPVKSTSLITSIGRVIGVIE